MNFLGQNNLNESNTNQDRSVPTSTKSKWESHSGSLSSNSQSLMYRLLSMPNKAITDPYAKLKNHIKMYSDRELECERNC